MASRIILSCLLVSTSAYHLQTSMSGTSDIGIYLNFDFLDKDVEINKPPFTTISAKVNLCVSVQPYVGSNVITVVKLGLMLSGICVYEDGHCNESP
ncbi:hypothetical protein F5884DRAFT_139060 [Xylogone sp. PMI_703]|nr:hypothetical protein F5884DRAFT_139060 [Xylogone sp. PMI_703]